MFYDAQIAGLPDSSPAVRLVKKRSAAELLERRSKVVAAVREHADLRIVNAGGTGSLDVTGADPVITELTAGSGLFSPGLFDELRRVRVAPGRLLRARRRPQADRRRRHAVLRRLHRVRPGAEEPAAQARLAGGALPARRRGCRGGADAGQGSAARDLRLGDRVLLRHAKAGELCERFDTVTIVAADGSVETVPTYRGEGKNFG